MFRLDGFGRVWVYKSGQFERVSRNVKELIAEYSGARNKVDFDGAYVSHLSYQLKFRRRAVSSNMEHADKRMMISGNQYLCDWGSKERIYCVTIDLHKSVQTADFAQNLPVVSGCGEALAISFFDIEQVGELEPTVRSFVLIVNLQSRSATPRIAFATPDDNDLQPWDKLEWTQPGYYGHRTSARWLNFLLVRSNRLGTREFHFQTSSATLKWSATRK